MPVLTSDQVEQFGKALGGEVIAFGLDLWREVKESTDAKCQEVLGPLARRSKW